MRSRRRGSIGTLTLLPAIVLLAVAACGGPKTEVRDNYDPDTDWGRVGSFVWLGIQAQGGFSEFNVKRLANAIRGDLLEKGLREVGARSEADIGVAAYLGVLPKAVDAWKSDGGIFWTKEKDVVSAGALVVEMIDLRTGQPIWRGVAERELARSPTVQQTDETIRAVVKKLLAGFPPQ